MGRLILFGCFILLLVGSSLGAVWDFGEDSIDSYVIATSDGKMHLLEKCRRVQLTIPPCYKVTHVRVEVQNDLATPAVTYNKDTHTVVIKYTWLQSGRSNYHIVAKGIPWYRCQDHARSNMKIIKYRPIDSDAIEPYSNDNDYRSQMKILNILKDQQRLLPDARVDPFYYD